METLDLKQAADYLKMHWQTLREKAKSGEVPGAKIGKQWVFIKDDLVSHIRSKYASPRSRSQVQRMGESLCYTSDQTRSSTGAVSPRRMDKEYSNLLKR
ncbi:MAG: helix-turn-helix domain-containing protein [Gammaproteobacteria bacterium]|nr:helix-turn-helix domain-containing protein [Gammaproteobacteria bacterium]